MEIIINKEKTLPKTILSRVYLENSDKNLNNIPQNNKFSIEAFKESIENSAILNYQEDFLSPTGTGCKVPNQIIINLVDNINQKLDSLNGNFFEHYDKKTGEITITESLLFDVEFIAQNFIQTLNASLGQEKTLAFTLLHEIGHAVAHQVYLHQKSHLTPNFKPINNYFSEKQKRFSDIIYPLAEISLKKHLKSNIPIIETDDIFEKRNFINFISQNYTPILNEKDIFSPLHTYDVNRAIYYPILEGFADIYSCIGITQLYPHKEAIEFIDGVINARNNANDAYYTEEILKEVKDEVQLHYRKNNFQNNIKLNTQNLKIENSGNEPFLSDFNALHQYIDGKIAQSSYNNFCKKLMLEIQGDKIKQNKHNNAFMGFLKALFEKAYNEGFLKENPFIKLNTAQEVLNVLLLKIKFPILIQQEILLNFNMEETYFHIGYQKGIKQLEKVQEICYIKQQELNSPLFDKNSHSVTYKKLK